MTQYKHVGASLEQAMHYIQLKVACGLTNFKVYKEGERWFVEVLP